MSLGQPRDVAFAAAEAAGLKVVFPAGDEVFIDLDEKLLPTWFYERMEMAQSIGLVRSWTWRHSKSGNIHVTAKIDNPWVGEADRIAIQAALGSDWKRELLSIQRVLNGDEDPTVFFQPQP